MPGQHDCTFQFRRDSPASQRWSWLAASADATAPRPVWDSPSLDLQSSNRSRRFAFRSERCSFSARFLRLEPAVGRVTRRVFGRATAGRIIFPNGDAVRGRLRLPAKQSMITFAAASTILILEFRHANHPLSLHRDRHFRVRRRRRRHRRR